MSFFFTTTATPQIYTLSLHDALPIYPAWPSPASRSIACSSARAPMRGCPISKLPRQSCAVAASPEVSSLRSEEHTSELQSHSDLVCRLLLEKKNKIKMNIRLVIDIDH